VLAALVAVAVLSGPPVIHETFTPLPCPAKAVSTLDMEGCAEKDILASDRKINTANAAIFTLLRPIDRPTFVAGERAWLRYRRASCLTAASKYAGGTAAGVVDATCVADRNRTHVREQQTLLRDLREH
jgi:uncharacterized protein YecT (DUF1311 family)